MAAVCGAMAPSKKGLSGPSAVVQSAGDTSDAMPVPKEKNAAKSEKSPCGMAGEGVVEVCWEVGFLWRHNTCEKSARARLRLSTGQRPKQNEKRASPRPQIIIIANAIAGSLRRRGEVAAP